LFPDGHLENRFDVLFVMTLSSQQLRPPANPGRFKEVNAKRHAGAKARRWVVEQTHSWLNRFRSILIRWAKNPANYITLLHFACAIIHGGMLVPG
jgi:transposase